MSLCPVCGLPLAIGDFPCITRIRPHGRGTNAVIDDSCDITQENFGHTPEHFSSKQAMARRAKELGLIPFVRNAGPNDKHVPRWCSVDLDAATALVSRM